ncbi:MAG: 16S rRNA (cytidine(1402)-2'-O)-methyltransferase [Chloroflexi bacterium]|nr:16S rRNA (cytidine(1402)-2'-O)-methyltransferase [Chloroflexota bacterium]
MPAQQISTLYLVATPIGNLEDITLRALRVLGEVSLIAAEDTRTVRKLLSRHGIHRQRIVSYTERNRRARIPAILAALRDGDVALVSEAGTPAISDPGVHLVEAAAAAGYRVAPVPGPSALTAALAASGLPARQALYLGFLPRAAGRRRKLLRELADRTETLVIFEAPHRMKQTLIDLHDLLGDRRVAVCRELTKLYEEIYRGTLAAAREHFGQPRGEFTLVIEGADEAKPKRELPTDVDAQLRELRARGHRARDAVREVTRRTGLSRQQVYRRWLAVAGPDEDGTPVS